MSFCVLLFVQESNNNYFMLSLLCSFVRLRKKDSRPKLVHRPNKLNATNSTKSSLSTGHNVLYSLLPGHSLLFNEYCISRHCAGEVVVQKMMNFDTWRKKGNSFSGCLIHKKIMFIRSLIKGTLFNSL